jgi:flagellar biosynthesis protein FliQ
MGGRVTIPDALPLSSALQFLMSGLGIGLIVAFLAAVTQIRR